MENRTIKFNIYNCKLDNKNNIFYKLEKINFTCFNFKT